MSGFRFSLERVLAWRRTELSLAEGEFARLLSGRNRIEEALNDLSCREAKESDTLRLANSLRGDDVAGLARSRNWALEERKRLRAALAECDRAIELKKAALLELERKVKLLERLREHRQTDWKHEQDRVLEELASESAVASWRRELGRNTAIS